jgi:hypothetical protein
MAPLKRGCHGELQDICGRSNPGFIEVLHDF